MIPTMPSITFEIRHLMHWEQVVDPNKIPNLSEQELYDLLHRIRGADERTPLKNEQEALAYAERVIRATHGDKAFTDQAPYTVEDRGENWFVKGTNSRLRGVLDPVHVELRKSDATVIDFGMTGFNGLKAPPAPAAP